MNKLELEKFNAIIRGMDESRLALLIEQKFLRSIQGTDVDERLKLDKIKVELTRSLDFLEGVLKGMESMGG